MPVEVIMPKLGMAMKEGTVSQWNKTEGEAVKKGDPIASISSEKIEMEIESPADGSVLKINVPEGKGVPPGTVICYIGNPDEEVAATAAPVQEEKGQKEEIQAAHPAPPPKKPGKARVKISPVARKMAEASGIKPEDIIGTGPGGRITKEDVEQAIKSAKESRKQDIPVQAVAGRTAAHTGIRHAQSDRRTHAFKPAIGCTADDHDESGCHGTIGAANASERDNCKTVRQQTDDHGFCSKGCHPCPRKPSGNEQCVYG